MYNQKDIQFAGKHDYDKQSAEVFANAVSFNSFSIGIFKWVLSNDGKRLKRGKVVVRIQAPTGKKEEAFKFAENVVNDLDNGTWDGRKTVKI